jgi:hypothetical protein
MHVVQSCFSFVFCLFGFGFLFVHTAQSGTRGKGWRMRAGEAANMERRVQYLREMPFPFFHKYLMFCLFGKNPACFNFILQ